MFELEGASEPEALIKVVGLGGCGVKAVAYMDSAGIEGAEFGCLNTDAQALRSDGVGTTIQIGCDISRGLGAGAQPEVGRQAAMEDRDTLEEYIRGTDMLFLVAGLGGGTGTGATPVLAQLAKELGILTVAVVSKPFSFEGKTRMHTAEKGVLELSETADSIIVIPNNAHLMEASSEFNLIDAFAVADQVFHKAVQAIAELITRPGLINVDFADIYSVMSNMGIATMGSGLAVGEERARKAAELALSSGYFDSGALIDARGVLVNVSAGQDFSIGEFQVVGESLQQFFSDSATIVVGTVIDPGMDQELRVTVVATGVRG